MQRLMGLALVVACRITNTADPPDPPSFRIVVEPDTVRARLNVQQRIQLEFLVRIFNDGPGRLFVPPCGHQVQLIEPNGAFLDVYAPPCPTQFTPPFAVDAGETYGYPVRITAPVDSGPWRRGSISGRYRALSYISAEFRAFGAWGRAVPINLLTAEFPVREQVP